jgi:putative ABC transport system permease protein
VSGLRFALRLAWRESRGARRSLLLLAGAIAAGVGALVAIRSFGDGVQESVRVQARSLLGADLALGSAAPFSANAEAQLADLRATARATGQVAMARVTSFGAMVVLPRTGATRLVQALAVEAGYPYYGEVLTEPAREWSKLAAGRDALVDAALLPALGAQVGDTLGLGEARFVIRGVVRNFPGDIAVRTSLGPRVFIPRARAEETGLLAMGSRARHEAYLRLPAGADPQRLLLRYRPGLAAERVSLRTVAEDQQRLSDSLGRLTRYLGLVGLVALLLGGIGVASAVHVLIRRRIETVAVLRCLGASSRRVMAVYLVEAGALGLAGSLAGAALGALAQLALPRLLGGFLPVDVPTTLSWPAVAMGLSVGLWTAVVFTMLPLLAVRRISPLVALRRDFEQAPDARDDTARRAAIAALAASIFAMAALQAGSLAGGAAFAAGIAAALGILALAARLLMRLLRARVSPRLPYVWRQGLANLHRPANQTLAVVLSLGLGVFLLATLVVIQSNLLRDLRVDAGAARPNLAVFDIQPDQLQGVRDLLREARVEAPPATPIVPMRITAVKGVPVSQMLAQSAAGAGGPRGRAWVFRREYRSTYRDAPGPAERLTAGAWWEPGRYAGAAEPGPVPVSLEVEIAHDLGVTVGDEIVWDIQGVSLPSRVASLREVTWARFEPNFFAVFPKGPLDGAPQTLVTLLRVEDEAERGRLERRLVERFPNLSALDLTQVQRAIEDVLGRVAWAVRFMALFSLATGLAVLAGALATSRFQRLREAVLLKTLGGTRRQVIRVVVAEYVALGAVASVVGVTLAALAGWALMRFAFEGSFALPVLPLAGFGLAVIALTVALGALGSAEMFRRTPLEVLRSE